jgi:hypothetical protein
MYFFGENGSLYLHRSHEAIERRKEIDVQIRGSLITAGLTFALVAAASATAATSSGSSAAAELSAHRFQVAAEIADGQHLVTVGHKNKPTVQVKVLRPTPSSSRLLIITEAVLPSSQPYVDPNACQDNGTGCTDAQLCQFYSVNCDDSADPGQTTDSLATDPSSGDQATGN